MSNFIKTNDSATAELLRKNHFEELSKEGSFFVFINCPAKLNFSEQDKNKMIFTNTLCL